MKKISKEAVDLIIEFEVSSKATYEKKYRRPEWPQGASGITIGIGYDVGYVTSKQLWSDWKGLIPDSMIQTLERAVGLKGAAANAILSEMRATVDIPLEAAMKVFETKTLPSYLAMVEKHLPNTDKLSEDSLGSLVSLAYNRGPSFGNSGPRYTEMRNIKECMEEESFELIPDEIEHMKRLWPDVKGLLRRRDAEAALFRKGLDKPPAKDQTKGSGKMAGGFFAMLVAAGVGFKDWIITHPWEAGFSAAGILLVISGIIYIIRKG